MVNISVDNRVEYTVPMEWPKKRNLNWMFWKSRRHIVTFMGLWGFFTLYTVRGNFSIAIVAMTKFVNVTLENGTIAQLQEFDWDSRQRGLALGSLFYFYICTQMIGGILAARFGGNIVFGCGIGISTILSIISLGAAKIGLYPLVAVRILIGLFQGVSFPSIQDIYSNWAPKYEKTTMSSLIHSGCQIGAFTSFLISGFFIEYFGWESVFYIFGGLGCIWFALWMIYIKRDPASDPRISKEERIYIESSREKITKQKLKDVPWKSVLTSKAVWAQTVPNSCDAFATFIYITQIPTYLNDVLGFNLGATGFFSAAPFLMYVILTPVASGLSDFLQSSNILSTTNVRKVCLSIGFLSSAICLIIMPNSTDITTIWACLIVAVGMSTFTKASYFSNPTDFAPAYASIILGYSNTFGTLPAIVAPTLAGFIVRNGTQDEWKVIFYIAAGLAQFGMIFFILFGQGEVQEWAKSKPTHEDSSKCMNSLQDAEDLLT